MQSLFKWKKFVFVWTDFLKNKQKAYSLQFAYLTSSSVTELLNARALSARFRRTAVNICTVGSITDTSVTESTRDESFDLLNLFSWRRPRGTWCGGWEDAWGGGGGVEGQLSVLMEKRRQLNVLFSLICIGSNSRYKVPPTPPPKAKQQQTNKHTRLFVLSAKTKTIISFIFISML